MQPPLRPSLSPLEQQEAALSIASTLGYSCHLYFFVRFLSFTWINLLAGPEEAVGGRQRNGLIPLFTLLYLRLFLR